MTTTLEILEKKLIRGDFVDGPALVPDAHTGDHSIAGYQDAEEGKPAAVLIPIMMRPAGLNIFFTQRPDTMKEHPGQIAFPGGQKETGDKTPVDTALREAHEEIGLDPKLVKIVGHLSPYQTITGYLVNSAIGMVPGTFVPTLDSHEVADAFEVPMAFFLKKQNAQIHTRIYRGKARQFFAFDFEGRFIWGVTAAILINLREALLAYAGAGD